MKIRVLAKEELKISQWSGGETRQVFLSPAHGVYEIGKFDYRLSSATVELKESIFSELTGYHRLIMSLDNEIRLKHESPEGIQELTLPPFQAHAFSGDDQTTSYGQCTDFNLIYKPMYKGSMKALNEAEQETLDTGVTIIYCLADVAIDLKKNKELIKSYQLEKYSSLILEDMTDEYQLEFNSQESFQPIVICSKIQ